MEASLVIVGNLVLSLILAWQALLRLNTMSRTRTRRRYRALYAFVILGGALTSAFSPAFGDDVHVGRLIVECIAIILLLESDPLWRNGCAKHAQRDRRDGAGSPG